MKFALSFCAGAAAALLAGPALAGSYFCYGGAVYSNGRCSDGSMPAYRADSLESPTARPLPQPSRQSVTAAARSLLGAWSTRVPGGVWQSPSAIPGWDTLHIGVGALSGLLVIYPDGRYIWNAYGGKRGSWTLTTNPEFPILLDDQAEGRKWMVGVNVREAGAIWIVDSKGSFHYAGKRPR